MNRFCARCGVPIPDGTSFCSNCGTPVSVGQAPPPVQGYYAYPQPPQAIPGSEKKLVAGILGILLGGLGVHKFYLGYIGTGILHIVLGILTCGMFHFVGLIEGIIYLTKTDQEFVDLYVNGRREWF